MGAETQRGGPLDGLLIVDLSERSVASAIAGMILADYGARVVRVEPTGGDPLRALTGSLVWLRGQESVTAGDGGLDESELGALCRSADVVLDTAQPWTAKSFSYGPPVPDDQVYCLLTAEPARVEEIAAGARPAGPVYGEVAEAKYGYMFVQDGVREPPIFIGLPHASVGAAWLMLLGVLGALSGRERTGRGQVVTTSLADALGIMNNWRWLGGGVPPLEGGPAGSNFTRVVRNSRLILALLECADGWIQLNSGSRGAGNRFFRLLGRDDLVDPELDVNPQSPFPSDELADEFWEYMVREFKKRTVQEWWDALSELEISAMPVYEPGRALSLEQALAQGISVRTARGAQFGLAARFERTPGTVGASPAEPGAQNSAHRRLPPRAVARVSNDGSSALQRGPLEGITVLELGLPVHVQGPLAMRLLADLGARVIKVVEPTLVGRHELGMLMTLNRGKECLAVDLKSDAGQRIVRRLVEKADVFQHGMRVGAMERLGLGAEALHALNPRLVYVHTSGYGNLGPWATMPVFGPMPDALSGAFVRTGGKGNPPFHAVGHVDFAAALNCAPMVLAALFERERSGRGQFLEVAQFGTSLLWMADCYVEDGEAVETFGLDSEQRGHAPTNALYRTRDGWIVLACGSEREWASAHSALDAQRQQTYAESRRRMFTPEDDAGPLAQRLASLDTGEALARLRAAGVACEEPKPLVAGELLDTDLARIGPIVSHTHPVRGAMYEVGRAARFSEAPDDLTSRASLAGEHTVAILEELSLSRAEIEDLLERGVVARDERVAPVTEPLSA
jgi:crotonobetainyl-CoA:carnitine CoA-transferase CaiB-like acyl-CoA transferase